MWFYLSLLLSVLLFITGLTGIVDGLVEWRESFSPMISTYVIVRDQLASIIPLAIPTWIFDYFLVVSAFGIAERYAQRAYPLPTEQSVLELFFTTILILLWPLLLVLFVGFTISHEKHVDYVTDPKNEVRSDLIQFWFAANNLKNMILILKLVAGLFAAFIVFLFSAVDFGRTFGA